MQLPLLLTLSRILLVPFFWALYLYGFRYGLQEWSWWISLFLLHSFFELTDLLDGMIARRRQQVTVLGKLLDPMADSFTRSSIIFVFTEPPLQLPLFIPLVLIYRDLLVSYLRIFVALDGQVLAARPSGKIKAVIQGCAIFISLFLLLGSFLNFWSLQSAQKVSAWLFASVALYALGSTVDYFLAHRRIFKNSLTQDAFAPKDRG